MANYGGIRLGPLLFTYCYQLAGASFIERAFSRDADNHEYNGLAILSQPWFRNEYKETQPQVAYVIGWRKKTKKDPDTRVDDIMDNSERETGQDESNEG